MKTENTHYIKIAIAGFLDRMVKNAQQEPKPSVPAATKTTPAPAPAAPSPKPVAKAPGVGAGAAVKKPALPGGGASGFVIKKRRFGGIMGRKPTTGLEPSPIASPKLESVRGSTGAPRKIPIAKTSPTPAAPQQAAQAGAKAIKWRPGKALPKAQVGAGQKKSYNLAPIKGEGQKEYNARLSKFQAALKAQQAKQAPKQMVFEQQ